jgi:hypothetical protein
MHYSKLDEILNFVHMPNLKIDVVVKAGINSAESKILFLEQSFFRDLFCNAITFCFLVETYLMSTKQTLGFRKMGI